MVLTEVAKAVLGYMPGGGTVSIRALTYNLHITEDEAYAGLQDLVTRGLIDQIRPQTYYLTGQGRQFKAQQEASVSC